MPTYRPLKPTNRGLKFKKDPTHIFAQVGLLFFVALLGIHALDDAGQRGGVVPAGAGLAVQQGLGAGVRQAPGRSVAPGARGWALGEDRSAAPAAAGRCAGGP